MVHRKIYHIDGAEIIEGSDFIAVDPNTGQPIFHFTVNHIWTDKNTNTLIAEIKPPDDDDNQSEQSAD
jgi:hypothetical protein